MIIIGNVAVSDAVVEEQFTCDLQKCKGACCVEGDSGAPLELDEMNFIEDEYDHFKEFLTEEGREVIETVGHFIHDKESGKMKTPLIKGAACAYIRYEDGISFCGIEKAWEAGKTHFRKPVSCHLYPVRIEQLKEYEAVNYEEWSICAPACSLGQKMKMPVYKFVKDALIRKYGPDFYEALEAAVAYKNNDNS
ncbi:MAG: DUF3109 family protein [Chitinophagales bacterium]|nr:DUF3109 family protein [Chitinophagales bacterium]